MGDTLSILAIALLLGLMVVSLVKQRAGMTRARADEHARTEGADVQHDRSVRRRAAARSAGHDPAA